jgi:L-lactate utilization protein LutB
VDETDRPTDPPVITDVEVLWNPFEDIVPRTTIEKRMEKAQAAKCGAAPSHCPTCKACNQLANVVELWAQCYPESSNTIWSPVADGVDTFTCLLHVCMLCGLTYQEFSA